MNESRLVTKRTALITGASGLIGSNLVGHLLRQNYQVIASDIDLKLLKEVTALYPDELKDNLKINEMDITSEKSIKEVIKQSISNGFEIDVLVNCAYPRNENYGKKLEDVSYNDFCENVSQNVGGYFLTSKILCQHFLNNGKGKVINLASVYGTLAPRFHIYEGTEITMPVEYSAIKSAIIQLTKYFAQYYKKENIQVNCVSPGGVFNKHPKIFVDRYQEFTGNIGMLNPNQVVKTINFLISEAAEGITGQNIIIDDGFSL